jgi:uncharacterized protein YqhQ
LKTLISAAVLDFSVISGLIDFSFVSWLTQLTRILTRILTRDFILGVSFLKILRTEKK